MPFGLGFGETLLIFLVLVLLFGPGKIPEIGGALGKGIRDFKSALNDREDYPLYRSPTPTLPPPDDALPWGSGEDQSGDAERAPEPTADVAVSETPRTERAPDDLLPESREGVRG
jgi:sec-independent protein translocase protein TatA